MANLDNGAGPHDVVNLIYLFVGDSNAAVRPISQSVLAADPSPTFALRSR
jgi:hypothetical protein